MAFGYPVMLEVTDRRCVVVGADAVREGKPEGLLAAGATDVLVVADAPADRLARLEGIPGVRVHRRPWRPADLDGAALVLASSRDAEERAALAREARARGALVNVMDDVSACDFAAPSVVRRGELVVAVGTGGASPALARALRERFERELGPEWAEVVEVLREVRDRTRALVPSLRVRAARWREALDLAEAQELVRTGRAAELRGRLVARITADRTEVEP
ncbi:MAG: precorrin-2 dehydrogenase [Actinomycetota bacterium]|jgi:siroheme synthase-like protein|nr:MAG: precorrin-2 dehydrogenase [Actinomycetota bacterium]